MSAPLDLGTIAPALAWLDERAVERGYQPPRLAGISLGGCADAHGTARVGAMRRSAHAHVDAKDELRGWLCFAAYGAARLMSSTGLPTQLLRHEYAHLLAPSDGGHGTGWRRAVAALGAPAEAKRYEQRAVERRVRRANTVYYRADGTVIR